MLYSYKSSFCRDKCLIMLSLKYLRYLDMDKEMCRIFLDFPIKLETENNAKSVPGEQ